MMMLKIHSLNLGRFQIAGLENLKLKQVLSIEKTLISNNERPNTFIHRNLSFLSRKGERNVLFG